MLIDFFGTFEEYEIAQSVFDKMKSVDEVCIGTIMKVNINRSLCEDALEIYEANESLNDDVCHSLAIIAAKNANLYEREKQIYAQIADRLIDVNIASLNALIDF